MTRDRQIEIYPLVKQTKLSYTTAVCYLFQTKSYIIAGKNSYS